MPVKKKSAPAKKTAAKAPVRKAASAPRPKAKKAAVSPAGSAKVGKTAAPATRTRALPADGLPPSSLPPAVLPPPVSKKSRRPAGIPAETAGTALARAVAQAADMKKAEQIVILDVRGLSMVTDFLVIASGSSLPHLRAIRNEISERIHEEREEKPHSSQGMAESQWVLLDYGDVVAHVFLDEKRALYALEDLWSDAPRLEWTPL